MPKPPKYIRNTGKPWNASDIETLKTLAQQDTPTPVIGIKLGRTPAAIYTMASQENISLLPRIRTTKRRSKPTSPLLD
jgi:hypothetical protein